MFSLAFSLSGLSQVFFDLLLQCLLLIPAFSFDLNFSSKFLAPLGTLGLSLLGSAFGLLLILFPRFTMTYQSYGIHLSFLMYLTPVVYPAPKEGFASIIVSYNPVTPLMECTVFSPDHLFTILFHWVGFHFLPYVDYG